MREGDTPETLQRRVMEQAEVDYSAAGSRASGAEAGAGLTGT